jgi:hypothetical protein
MVATAAAAYSAEDCRKGQREGKMRYRRMDVKGQGERHELSYVELFVCSRVYRWAVSLDDASLDELVFSRLR